MTQARRIQARHRVTDNISQVSPGILKSRNQKRQIRKIGLIGLRCQKESNILRRHLDATRRRRWGPPGSAGVARVAGVAGVAGVARVLGVFPGVSAVPLGSLRSLGRLRRRGRWGRRSRTRRAQLVHRRPVALGRQTPQNAAPIKEGETARWRPEGRKRKYVLPSLRKYKNKGRRCCGCFSRDVRDAGGSLVDCRSGFQATKVPTAPSILTPKSVSPASPQHNLSWVGGKCKRTRKPSAGKLSRVHCGSLEARSELSPSEEAEEARC